MANARALLALGTLALLLSGRRRKVGENACPDIYEHDEPTGPVEEYAPYVGESSCDPNAKPGVILFREYVWERFGGGNVGIGRACDPTKRSEHEEGRAWDWGIVAGADLPGDGMPGRWPADVDGFIQWLLCTDSKGNEHAIARRAGVMYLIYNQRIWRAYDKDGQPKGHWWPYSGGDPHTTHIHISFSWPGARAETSLYPLIQGAEGGPTNVS